jgi:hypothetical protein
VLMEQTAVVSLSLLHGIDAAGSGSDG